MAEMQRRYTGDGQGSYSNESVTVAESGDTTIAEFDVTPYERVWVEVQVVGQALDAFKIYGRYHPKANFNSLASLAAHYTAPAGALFGTGRSDDPANSDLTTIPAAARGWFALDVRGIERVRITASSGNVAGSTVSVFASGM